LNRAPDPDNTVSYAESQEKNKAGRRGRQTVKAGLPGKLPDSFDILVVEEPPVRSQEGDGEYPGSRCDYLIRRIFVKIFTAFSPRRFSEKFRARNHRFRFVLDLPGWIRYPYKIQKKEKAKGLFPMLMFRRMTTLTKRTTKGTVTPMGSFDGGPW